jgi:CRP/FNR family cyclic AMP-dependent transcriptional regulator
MTTTEACAQASLSPAVLDELLSLATLVRYGAGDYIFREGDPALDLCILSEGEVALELNLPAGRTVIATAGPGEWFGWTALVAPRVERTSARAIRATEVWQIHGGAILDHALEAPRFGFEIYRALAELVSARLTASWMELLRGVR